jgi:hypothetical protein
MEGIAVVCSQSQLGNTERILEMLRIDARRFAAMVDVLLDLAPGFNMEGEGAVAKDEAENKFGALIASWNELGWPELAAQAERLQRRALAGEIGKHMQEMTSDLREAFLERVERDALLVIPSLQRKYYDQTEPLFGKVVADALPESAQEISEAGKCFALDRWTACVFHLMRALELSLHRIAKQLGTSFPAPIELQDWGTIVKKIDARIRELEQQSRGQQKAEDLRFYSSLNLEFEWFKNAWRNSISHARESYNEQEAANILNHVEKFLNEIANRPTI